ncbi:hypothetical protein BHE74_00022456 [Ensete ventricosum]|nr:hypothetical protein BHE74_00022456 [Ensete ventricosum]RZS23432.1 hypothetical protein BHM03_00056371 [Ensete ventricosum]
MHAARVVCKGDHLRPSRDKGRSQGAAARSQVAGATIVASSQGRRSLVGAAPTYRGDVHSRVAVPACE